MSNLNLFASIDVDELQPSRTVGKSQRTPCKHDWVDKLLGREVGASTAPRFDNYDVHIIDLCSGDGIVGDDQEWCHSCSPGIIARHATHAARGGRRVHVWGHEKATGTFGTLVESLKMHMPEFGYRLATDDENLWIYEHPQNNGSVQYHVRNIDSSIVEFDHIGQKSLVFIVNDPNNINAWAANAGTIRPMVQRGARVTTLHTMGCNVGGLKRLSYNDRMGWQRYVNEVLTYLDGSRQTCFIACLDGDDSRWGYLVTYPKSWSEKLCNDMRSSFSNHRLPLRIAEHGTDEFNDILDYLFLTRDEMNAGIKRAVNV
jgi:hypothetical protein